MQINYQDLLKEQIVFILLPIILLVVLIGGGGYAGFSAFSNMNNYNTKAKEVQTLTQQKMELEAQLAQQQREEKSPDMKKIFELQGLKFGTDASFAPLFDNMITVAKESGIRIRSVDYNYAPEKDPIFAAKLPGYNVCELETTIVGKYSEIQTFLKTILSENYLVNLAQIEIVSWQRDKSVLIANLKLRYYTKTN
ncbi:MAG: type 4a pilus biogenesis protein PilO [bacterium]|nr:type 4a pilus biogenesis protein PilO [bacterium]